MTNTNYIMKLSDIETPDLAERFWSRVDTSGDCWNWISDSKSRRYGRIWAKREMSAHRVSYLLTHGEIPDGLYVCHHCDNGLCVRPTHLFLGTPKDNMLDATQKGRLTDHYPHYYGEENPKSKLTRKKVDEIRVRYSRGVKGTVLSKEFRVSASTISAITRGITWKDESCETLASNPQRKWTKEEVEDICSRREHGETRQAIADSYGVCTVTITRLTRNKLSHDLPNPRAKLTWAQVSEIRSRYKSGGETQTSLAKEFGMSRREVGAILQGKKWKSDGYVAPIAPPPKWGDERKRDICSRREQGETLQSIADSYGTERSYMGKLVKRWST